ncbi:hypothetical protein STCU_01311 [Strigomonas culicis]|uniref:SH3 domain-containing protein n=1 Tax=Strigomonas culicis TaxID=28005 RepID=S9W6C4_9TRYP|nr:hypothetical protein STCU_01311 [Strigomonas culicis]|eukprot:EPY34791.1 hypothetical protein STCU_01311 [Strigomonas culicis]
MSGERCVALVDYAALTSDEISFHAGDVISVTAKGGYSGFWQGHVLHCPHAGRTASSPTGRGSSRADGPAQKGLFLSCFVTSNVQGLQSPFIDTFVNKAVCLYDSPPLGDQETQKAAADTMAFRKNDILTVLAPSAHPGWWYGVNETARWREAAAPRPAEIRLFPTNFVSCRIVLAVYEFVAAAAGADSKQKEVGCLPGDVLLLHRQWNDGWWEGTRCGFFPLPPAEGRAAAVPPATRERLEARRAAAAAGAPCVNPRGIFPSNYTTPNLCTTRPLFFCQKCKQIRAEAQQAVSPQRPSTPTPVSPRDVLQLRGGLTAPAPPYYLSDVGGGSAASCTACAQQELVVDHMLRNLARLPPGPVARDAVDLFSGIPLLPPRSGEDAGGDRDTTESKLSLLSLKDVADAKNIKFD